jgi:hypothetical protein
MSNNWYKGWYEAIVNGKYLIRSHTIRGIKTQASKVANNDYNRMDSLHITAWKYKADKYSEPIREPVDFKYSRINRVCPNNTIIRGSWN